MARILLVARFEDGLARQILASIAETTLEVDVAVLQAKERATRNGHILVVALVTTDKWTVRECEVEPGYPKLRIFGADTALRVRRKKGADTTMIVKAAQEELQELRRVAEKTKQDEKLQKERRTKYCY